MTLALGADPAAERMPESDGRASPDSLPGGVPAAPSVRLLGLEEELLLVDAETFLPRPVAGEILRDGPLALPFGSQLEAEVKSEQIEVVTAPLSTLAEVREAVLAGRRAADEHARAVGARAVALSTPVDPCEPHLVHKPRYERMAARFGLTMDEQLTSGLHVHVSIASPDEGVAVLDRIRPWLPALLALSANSPFWQGVDSRYDSFRYQAWTRWPSAGAYERFHTRAGYERAVGDILDSGVSLDPGMIYFDARLSSHAPTVEVRICDVPFAPEDAAALAVLIRALVETAASEWRRGVPADDVTTMQVRLAAWRASRWGLGQELMSPASRALVPAAAVIDELIAHVAEHFTTPAESSAVRQSVADILRRGNGATRQRLAHAHRGTAGVVSEALALIGC